MIRFLLPLTALSLVPASAQPPSSGSPAPAPPAAATAPAVPSIESIQSIGSISSIPPAASGSTEVILVRGADGQEAYAAKFDAQLAAWQKAATAAGAAVTVIRGRPGSPASSADSPVAVGSSAITNAEELQKALSALAPDGSGEVWIVLLGHGTWDGREARFNLDGPDVSATQLAEWLKPLRRPLVFINTASSSAPFLSTLAGPQRTILTATRGGAEKNYARFGEYLAAALEDPSADYDADGQFSLLEWALTAATRTADFYKNEGRIATEHALLDDNGDGKGTPLEWFEGLRAVKKSKDNLPLDGPAANHIHLIPDKTTRAMPAEKRGERDRIEAGISALRGRKASLKEDEFYRQLEVLLRQLAAVYD